MGRALMTRRDLIESDASRRLGRPKRDRRTATRRGRGSCQRILCDDRLGRSGECEQRGDDMPSHAKIRFFDPSEG